MSFTNVPTDKYADRPMDIGSNFLFQKKVSNWGKILKYSDNPEKGNSLPTIAEEIDNLDGLAIETLKAMAAKEKVNAHIPSKMKKPKLVNLLRKHHAETLKKIYKNVTLI